METRTIAERWKGEPAPLLSVLHAYHDRDGWLSEEVIREIAAGLDIPLAQLYGIVTFYHHLAMEPPGRSAPRVCDGPVCRLVGSRDLLEALPRSRPMACAGRCDDPVPVLQGSRCLVGRPGGVLEERPTPLPRQGIGGYEECLFRHIREPGRHTLDGYVRTGGYAALQAVREGIAPGEVIERIAASGLAGRGGAGFPTGAKWKAVAEATRGPGTIVCNADEGEPGCFKDRALLDHDPHGVIEGMILAAHATGVTRGFIYLRYEYPQILPRLERALSEAEEAGWLGEGSGFRIRIRRGAGAYICGEEGSLLNSLEGKHPFPRNRPPYPVTHGYLDLPTAVNNVETLAAVPPILRKGADWYRSLGLGEHAGTKIISLSGDIRRPGNYEVPIGLPLRTLLHDWAGGPPEGRTVQAVTMAGLSGGFLAGADLEVTLDDPAIRSRGSFLGAGGIIVYDDSRDMVAASREAMEFFADESCGKCFPCRIGTRRLAERLKDGGGADLPAWRGEVEDLGEVMMSSSACGLGLAAPNITRSLLRHFPDQVGRHVQGGEGWSGGRGHRR